MIPVLPSDHFARGYREFNLRDANGRSKYTTTCLLIMIAEILEASAVIGVCLILSYLSFADT